MLRFKISIKDSLIRASSWWRRNVIFNKVHAKNAYDSRLFKEQLKASCHVVLPNKSNGKEKHLFAKKSLMKDI